MRKVKPPRIKNPVQLDERATEMVEQLTVDEKINQLGQPAERTEKLPGQLRKRLPDTVPGGVKLINK